MQVGNLELTKVHSDLRRTIYQYNDEKHQRSIQGFDIHAFLPLGKHAHEKKEEIFCILKGGGEVLMQLSYDGKPVHITDKPVKTILTPGSVVIVPKNMAHTFYLRPGTSMICFSSSAYNPNDKDMISCNWLVANND